MKRKLVARCVLAILILLNLFLIYGFSSEDAKRSGTTSKQVTQAVASVVVKDFQEKPQSEKNSIVAGMHPSVRSMAHVAEFGSLGLLVMLFVLTFRVKPLLAGGISMLSVSVVASLDELHQHLANAGRAAQFKDVALDCLGALITCSALFLLILLLNVTKMKRAKKALRVTRYRVPCATLTAPLRIALVSDLHNNPWERVVVALQKEAPDLILIPGDLTADENLREDAEETVAFLRECASIAPTFYSLGNHEIGCYHGGNPFRHPIPIPIPDEFKKAVAQAGATLLDNESTVFNGLTVFGLSSGINRKENRPDPTVLEKFASTEGSVKIMLCHHPEYYIPYLKDLGMDLIVSGHAHGGHWRFFGRGVYAPGQGLLPKYTAGIVDNVCVIGRGLGDHTLIPRIFNPHELVMIELGGKEEI